jgi:tRNA pseudouridine55 synthase
MMQNRLFVANKPINISSNGYLSYIKKKYKVKKAGFSGTLDPFACGCLIVAFGQYPKLFRYLKKAPKSYRSVLWLGAKSSSLDIERVENIEELEPFSLKKIKKTLNSLRGEIDYFPPKFSAKKIDGKKAYKLAREDKEVELKKITSTIYDIKLLNYSHPFLTFKINISEGGYIRSIGEIISKKLGVNGALSFLERLNEGEFIFENEKPLDPTLYLKIPQNFYLKEKSDVLLGKKLKKEDFKIKDRGEYFLVYDGMLSVIDIKDNKVSYKLNGVKLC